jgi:hypothetical protein
MQKQSEDEIVVINLERWRIPYLLGALRLGMRCEDWCAEQLQTPLGSYDTYSPRWIMKIAGIIKLISIQTGIEEEYRGSGYPEILNYIQKLINKDCAAQFEELHKNTESVLKKQSFKKSEYKGVKKAEMTYKRRLAEQTIKDLTNPVNEFLRGLSQIKR